MTNSVSQTPASALAPPAAMLPPEGCRAAVAGWPQLLRAVGTLALKSAVPIPGPGGASGIPQVGSPAQLITALSVNPALLGAAQPPNDAYAQFVWFTARLSAAAKTMAGTLGQLPAVLAASAAATPQQRDAFVREVLTGSGGLAQTADKIAGLAADLAGRVGQLHGALDLDHAPDSVRSAAETLAHHALATAAAKPLDAMLVQSSSAEGAQRVRVALDRLESGSAGTAASAVLTNLGDVLQAAATQWKGVGASLAAAVAAASPPQLGDVNYLRASLQLEAATQAWADFAASVQAYVQRLLLARPG